MRKLFSVFIINFLFLISPSDGYSQWQLWCGDGEYYKMWVGCTNNNEQLVFNSYTGDLQAVQSMLEAGADVDYQDNYGRTALIRASRRGYLEVVESLLEAGADVNYQNYLDYTALKWASELGHLEIVEALKEAGATE